ncbi:MAG: hypothetical protein IPK20_21730 [Betaproteobacteria bacterium]|nr:hypothetical protein [Betaproteobacteria bacterium]
MLAPPVIAFPASWALASMWDPSLDGMRDRRYVAGMPMRGPGDLARWIERPSAVRPGTLMPDLGVTPGDARAMADYLLAPR